MGDGASKRYHLEKVYRATGEKPEELEQVEMPFTMEIIWHYFNDLSSARDSNGYGSNPLSYTNIQAFNELTDAQLTPLEVKIIKRLDIAYLNFQADKQKQKQGKK